IPLADAWIELSSDGFDRTKWRALQRSPANDFDYRDTIDLGDWLPNTREGRQAKLHLIERVEKANLMARLYSGELWAVGFRTRPSRGDAPEQVPRDLFHTDPTEDLPLLVTNWDKGE